MDEVYCGCNWSKAKLFSVVVTLNIFLKEGRTRGSDTSLNS
jgi:hypothetical protein